MRNTEHPSESSGSGMKSGCAHASHTGVEFHSESVQSMISSITWDFFVPACGQHDRTEKPGDGILEIRTPADGRLRSRKIVTRSRSRGTGKYPSLKAGRMVQWETINDLNAFRLLECDPYVRSYREKPFEIKYRLEGVIHRHYPGILVVTRSGNELWDIETNADAALPNTIKRSQLMESCLPTHGYRYRVVLAQYLSTQPRLSNALFLVKHGRQASNLEQFEYVRAALDVTPNLGWEKVLAGALGPQGRQYICRLILSGSLEIDMGKPIEGNSRNSAANDSFATKPWKGA